MYEMQQQVCYNWLMKVEFSRGWVSPFVTLHMNSSLSLGHRLTCHPRSNSLPTCLSLSQNCSFLFWTIISRSFHIEVLNIITDFYQVRHRDTTRTMTKLVTRPYCYWPHYFDILVTFLFCSVCLGETNFAFVSLSYIFCAGFEPLSSGKLSLSIQNRSSFLLLAPLSCVLDPCKHLLVRKQTSLLGLWNPRRFRFCHDKWPCRLVWITLPEGANFCGISGEW